MVKIPRRGASAPANTTKTTGGATADQPPPGRLRQIGMLAGVIRKSDPRALPITIGSGVGIIIVFVVVGLLIGQVGFLIPLGVLLGVMTSMILFGRYGQSAQYKAISGQPGAAAAIVQQMQERRGIRGNWTVTPAVAGNRNMDIVHRVVGRPGVVLLGECSPSGLASLMVAEKRKIARIAYGVPIIEMQVGENSGQVPISQLQRKLMRLPRELKQSAVTDLNNRLKAMPSTLQQPRGPMPRSGRMPKPPRPKVR